MVLRDASASKNGIVRNCLCVFLHLYILDVMNTFRNLNITHHETRHKSRQFAREIGLCGREGGVHYSPNQPEPGLYGHYWQQTTSCPECIVCYSITHIYFLYFCIFCLHISISVFLNISSAEKTVLQIYCLPLFDTSSHIFCNIFIKTIPMS